MVMRLLIALLLVDAYVESKEKPDFKNVKGIELWEGEDLHYCHEGIYDVDEGNQNFFHNHLVTYMPYFHCLCWQSFAPIRLTVLPSSSRELFKLELGDADELPDSFLTEMTIESAVRRTYLPPSGLWLDAFQEVLDGLGVLSSVLFGCLLMT